MVGFYVLISTKVLLRKKYYSSSGSIIVVQSVDFGIYWVARVIRRVISRPRFQFKTRVFLLWYFSENIFCELNILMLSFYKTKSMIDIYRIDLYTFD